MPANSRTVFPKKMNDTRVQWPGLPPQVTMILETAERLFVPETTAQLAELALGEEENDTFDVEYDLPNGESVCEASVVRCRNGIAVNFPEPYMRRRDPNCMVIADDRPTDQPRFADRFRVPFGEWRDDITNWLAKQDLLVLPFRAGDEVHGYDALLIAPRNAAFFAAALANLQGMIPASLVPKEFSPRAVIYLAPPFRHTHCEGQQVVIHDRSEGLHEVYSLNLYPGPAAKKAIYGVLLAIGEEENWLTAHGAVVQVVTPYDNLFTIMHEGASGGGKSEMLEYPHRDPDGRLCLGENLVTGERMHFAMKQGCELRPVTDDMALCHAAFQKAGGKLVTTDAERGWFVRVNHIEGYGTDPRLESLCVHPTEPLVFLNLHAVAKATCLIWETIEDAPGRPCPNPRVILPRSSVPNVLHGPVEIDVRSFGVRTPPCTRELPSYGIIGFLHVLPAALAWLWRLVSPRGYSNPSIADSDMLSSEGVGSYWPFATGRRVDQANLLLNQIRQTPATRYVLSPNQHVGAWKVSFMPQWIAREYLTRRGSVWFRPDKLVPARCPLLGDTPNSIQIDGVPVPNWLIQVDRQPEVGEEAYDAGAAILTHFFKQQLEPYLHELDLEPIGRKIIECCIDGGCAADYDSMLDHSN